MIKSILLRHVISIEQLKSTQDKILLWIKRIGWVGFAFFLIKGLVWVAVWMGVKHLFE